MSSPEAVPAAGESQGNPPPADAAPGATPGGEQTPDHDHVHAAVPTLNPDCTREVEVEVPAEEVARSFQNVVKRYQKAARIPGFRLGKIPETLIRSRFGEKIRQEVMEEMLPAHFRSALEKQHLQPVSKPEVSQIDFAEGKPLHFKAAFEVVPEFSVEGYQQVKVEKPDTQLTDAEFATELERVRDSRATMEPVTEERALTDGDFAEISFTGHVEGPPAEEPAAEGGEKADESQPIVGNDVLIEVGGKNTLESFTTALRGARPGQQLKFEVSYPEEFGERKLAGKTVAYDVEVKAIKKKNLPELNDAFAKELGPYESFAAFSEMLRNHFEAEKRRQLEGEARNKLIEALSARYNFPLPESLVQQQIDARLDRGLRALAAQGMSTEDMRKLDFDRLRQAQRDLAAAEVKGSLVLDRIADAEQVDVAPDEIDREIEELAKEAREPAEALRKRLTENGGIARIREQLRRQKVSNLLYERLAS